MLHEQLQYQNIIERMMTTLICGDLMKQIWGMLNGCEVMHARKIPCNIIKNTYLWTCRVLWTRYTSLSI